MYKSKWEAQREKGFELHLDSLSILTAKSKRDLASDVSQQKMFYLEKSFLSCDKKLNRLRSHFVSLQIKYKEEYQKNKGKVIGIKSVSDDSQMAHSALATKLQSDRHYKKEYEDTKTKYR